MLTLLFTIEAVDGGFLAKVRPTMLDDLMVVELAPR